MAEAFGRRIKPVTPHAVHYVSPYGRYAPEAIREHILDFPGRASHATILRAPPIRLERHMRNLH